MTMKRKEQATRGGLSSQRRTARTPGRRLLLESLERRYLLSGSGESPPEGITFNDNVLTINGTQYNDVAQVAFYGQSVHATLTHNRTTSSQFMGQKRADVHKIVFLGHDGNDTFINRTNIQSVAEGGNGNDTLCGGSGVDHLYGEEEYLSGAVTGYPPSPQPQDDKLVGGGGNDTLIGGYGADKLYGEEGDDFLDGKWGDDYLDGGDGRDTIFGGWGDDIVSGGADADRIYGNAGDDYLWGGAGGDSIYGNDGKDWICGGNGADLIAGGPHYDVINGDEGALPRFGYGVPEGEWRGSGLPGNDTLYGGAGTDHIYAGPGDDLVFGGWGNDLIFGQSGNDELHGGDGNDTIWAGFGDDSLSGGDGDDTLRGEWGSDQLNGGYGLDYLYGGDDPDILYGGLDLMEDHLYGEGGVDYFLYLAGTQPKEIKDGHIGENASWAWPQWAIDWMFSWANKKDPWASH